MRAAARAGRLVCVLHPRPRPQLPLPPRVPPRACVARAASGHRAAPPTQLTPRTPRRSVAMAAASGARGGDGGQVLAASRRLASPRAASRRLLRCC
jgi:hypothetical protein